MAVDAALAGGALGARMTAAGSAGRALALAARLDVRVRCARRWRPLTGGCEWPAPQMFRRDVRRPVHAGCAETALVRRRDMRNLERSTHVATCLQQRRSIVMDMRGMTYLLRLVLPDRPGSLGAVATALGAAGVDIESLDVIERGPEAPSTTWSSGCRKAGSPTR